MANRSEDSVPRDSEIKAARAALEAAADVLERMHEVDPFVARELRELAQDLDRVRGDLVGTTIEWTPDDLKQMYQQSVTTARFGNRGGPGWPLRELERIEADAPDVVPDSDPLVFDDPRVEWIHAARKACDYDLGVLATLEWRCTIRHPQISIPECARYMRERLLFLARSCGAVESIDEWRYVELPRLEQLRSEGAPHAPRIGGDLARLLMDRVAHDDRWAIEQTDLMRARREIEALSAYLVVSNEPGRARRKVRETAAEFDEAVPSGWFLRLRPDGLIEDVGSGEIIDITIDDESDDEP